MKAETVIELLELFAENGIETVLDGGWGVDALLGFQTREHSDLDIAIPHRARMVGRISHRLPFGRKRRPRRPGVV